MASVVLPQRHHVPEPSSQRVAGSKLKLVKLVESANMTAAGALETVQLSWIALVASKVADHPVEIPSGDASPERSSVHVVAVDTYAHVPAAFLT